MAASDNTITDKKLALIQSRLARQGIASRDRRITAAPRTDANTFPASYAQQRLWFFHQLDPLSAAYNMPMSFRFKGGIDTRLIKRSLAVLSRRHESLRTSFRLSGDRLLQVVSDPYEPDVPVIPLTVSTEDEGEQEIRRLAAQAATRPFNLDTGPLIRFELVEVGDADHVLLICAHHIVFDGASIGILTNELCTIYEALVNSSPIPLPKPALQYGDYAVWEQNQNYDDDLAYWLERLSGSLPILDLPSDRGRQPAGTLHRAAYAQTTLSEAAANALRDLTRAEGTTQFTVLLAAFHVLLSRYTNSRDIITGTTVTARTRSELSDIIGCFVNLLMIRSKLDDPTFREHVRQVHAAVTEAYAHQNTAFDQLVRELRPDRDQGRSPLVQIVFESGNIGLTAPRLSDIAIYPIWTGVPATAKFDLGVTVANHGDSVLITFEYDADLFEESAMERMARHYNTLITNALSHPDARVSALDILTDTERHRVLVEWNGTQRELPRDKCVHQLIEEQVLRTPDKRAVALGDAFLTYAELNGRANRLAHALMQHGAGPGALVGVCLPRSPDAMVAVLAVLKSGAAYVPLDPAHPHERLLSMAGDTGLTSIVTDASRAPELVQVGMNVICIDELHCDEPGDFDSAPRVDVSAGDRIYAIHTSGSTGAPKAAELQHSGFANLISWYLREFELSESDKFLVISSLAFDLTQKNLFAPLVAGAEIVMYAGGIFDPAEIADIVERDRITVLNCTPSAAYPIIKACVGRYDKLRSLRYLFLGGEPISTNELRAWVESGEFRAEIVNTYGPTECTDVATYYRLTAADYAKLGSPPIGRPIDNVSAFVLDAALCPVPIGVHGMLYIGGAGVGRGYLNRPELTADKFIPSPFAPSSAERLYRTGDTAMYLPDGNLVYVGREDNQVKIRGYRIELGEIESAVREHPSVEQCVVAHQNRNGSAELVCYVVPEYSLDDRAATGREAHRTLTRELADFLGKRLPKYMAPRYFVTLKSMPVTPTGKLDRKSLPAPSLDDRVLADGYVAPQTPLEQTLCGVWEEVLGVGAVGVNDNFFELGGHSLLATQAIARLRGIFSPDIPLRTLFDAPTVALFVGAMAEYSTIQSPIDRHIERAPDDVPIPLSYTQQRFWLLCRHSHRNQYYHINVQLQIPGDLDYGAVDLAFHRVVLNHAILRMNCLVKDGGVYQVHAESPRLKIDHIDLRHLTEEERQQEYGARIIPAINQPFELTRDSLLRIAVIRWTATDHRIVAVFHRMIADGRTIEIFFEDFVTALSGITTEHRAADIRYSDYAYWQHQCAAQREWDGDLAYWRQKLVNPPRLAVALGAAPDEGDGPFPIRTYPFSVPDDVFPRLKRICGEGHTTLNTLLLTGFGIALRQLTGSGDLLIASTTAGRSLPELDRLAGPCPNLVLVRFEVPANAAFLDLLAAVHRTTIEAYDHGDVPFLLVQEELARARAAGDEDHSWSPRDLYTVSLVHHHPRVSHGTEGGNADDAPIDVREWRASSVDPTLLDMQSYQDICLNTIETVEGLCGYVEYRPSLFVSTSIEEFIEMYVAVLAAVTQAA